MPKLKIQEVEINVTKFNNEDYICLTDMMMAKDGEFFCHRLVEKQKHFGVHWYLGKGV